MRRSGRRTCGMRTIGQRRQCAIVNTCHRKQSKKLSGQLDLEDWSGKDSNEATHFRSFLSETLRSIKICSSYALPHQFSITQLGKTCIVGSLIISLLSQIYTIYSKFNRA